MGNIIELLEILITGLACLADYTQIHYNYPCDTLEGLKLSIITYQNYCNLIMCSNVLPYLLSGLCKI